VKVVLDDRIDLRQSLGENEEQGFHLAQFTGAMTSNSDFKLEN
jgi:hypothetical protein